MPSTSERQRRLMEAAASDPEVARETGVPQKVARKYRRADRRKRRPTTMDS